MSDASQAQSSLIADVVRGLVYTHNRVHLCKAACCRLPLALSKEDVLEGIVRWDLGQPYMIAHEKDGYCIHFERGACCCTIHAHRPIPCRGYDCRKDQRIWLDFNNQIVNPRLDEPGWPEAVESQATSSGGAMHDG